MGFREPADAWCGVYVKLLEPFYERFALHLVEWVDRLAYRVARKINLIAITSEAPPRTPLAPPTPPPSPSLPTVPHQAPENFLRLQRENDNLKQLLAEARREVQEWKDQVESEAWVTVQLQVQVARLEVELAFLGRDLGASFVA